MKNKVKIIAIVLARFGSTRLKNKMIKIIDKKKVIDLFIERLKQVKKLMKLFQQPHQKKKIKFL